MKPKISIIMPVLNGERYIGEALESIAGQTYQRFELVVVDDGSADRTHELVSRFEDRIEIRHVRHEQCCGITVSVNDGLRNASGEYIAFLDHDDAWFPDFLETQVDYLETHPDVGMAYSDFQTIDPAGNVLESSVATCRKRNRPSGDVFRKLFMDSFIVANGALIRKECFDRLGGFDPTLRWADYHMWLRIAQHYRIDYVPKVLAKYRQHPAQNTRSIEVERPDEESAALLAIRTLLERDPELRRQLGDKLVRRRMANLYYDMAYSWLWAGAHKNARVCLRRSIGLCPARLGFYSTYLLCLFGHSHAVSIRRGWRKLRGLVSAAGSAGDANTGMQYEEIGR
jgi:glycosyltransferase involved in cell wall biosynthesis